jgi:hypothetical protein
VDTFFQGNEELALATLKHQLEELFPRLLSRSRFNRRRRALTKDIERARRFPGQDRLHRRPGGWK